MKQQIPEWFAIGSDVTAEVAQRIANAVKANAMALQVKSSPMLAHWFVQDSLLLANQANREGMHANALALTRQCVEAIGIIELGVCGHPGAEAALLRWDADKLSPGNLRAWLEVNVWQAYGLGVWNEPWSTFMREFAAAIQPYSHYSSKLAQWQLRLQNGTSELAHDSNAVPHLLIEIRPRAYDAQKATRITLFHALLTYTLGRIWMARNPTDKQFCGVMDRFRLALGKSKYLDGHETDWGSQFWAALWASDGRTILE
ncbi:hypothetical protein ACNHE5_10775 [Pandoraea pnomenusa]|uniref:hypothetical protein n=1 Tax=Pandoraea pnomenusa TaxID=93220 RepID=UPI003CEA14EB